MRAAFLLSAGLCVCSAALAGPPMPRPIGDVTFDVWGEVGGRGSTVVYSNLEQSTDPDEFYLPQTETGVPYGDDLHLTAGGWMDGFTFAYYDPAGGTALGQVEVLFYENDPNNSDFPGGDPGSTLLGSYTVSGLPGDGAHIFAVDVSDSPLSLPEDIWIEFDFSNSPEAGLVLYDPPTVGNSTDLFEVHGVDVFVFAYPYIANFGLEITTQPAPTTLYVDDDAPGDPGPGDATVSDPLEDGSVEHPFDGIQEAIEVANDGDTVVVLDGAYTGTGNKDLDFDGRAITVRSENGPDNCIIDCEQSGRGLVFHSGETNASVVEGLTIRNGWQGYGGAVYCVGSSPTIAGCLIIGNAATDVGGGIFCGESDPLLVNCTIVSNEADGGGGVFCDASSPKIIGCTFNFNIADWGGGVVGYNSSGLTIINSTFSINVAESDFGGAVYAESGNLTVTNCAIVANVGTDGALHCVAGTQATISNCTLAGNVGPSIECSDGVNVALADSVLWNGFEYWEWETIVLLNTSELAVSYSDVEDGIASAYVESGSTLTWGDGNRDADPRFLGGPSGVWTADAVYDPQTYRTTLTDASASWEEGELVGKFVNVDVNPPPPLFCVSQEIIVANTSTTLSIWADMWTIEAGYFEFPLTGLSYQIYDYHLAASSPCTDAGNNDAVPPDDTDLDGDGDYVEPLPLDLDRHPRFADDAGIPDSGAGSPPIVDMGAFEFQGETCFGDLDGDGDIDLAELAQLLGSYGETSGMTYSDGDLDADGDVDLADLAALLGVYGDICP